MENKFINCITDSVNDRDEKKRTMTVIVSDESVNRYGHIIKADGWDVSKYKINPVVLVNHRSDSLPVAKTNRIWMDKKNKRLMATIQFVDEGVSPEADLSWKLFEGGFMNSVSAGYMVDWNNIVRDEKKNTTTFNGPHELLEISLATIPANTNAIKQNSFQDSLKEAIDLGVVTEDFIQKVNMDVFTKEQSTTKSNSIETVEVQNSEQNNEETEIIDLFNIDVQKDKIEESIDVFDYLFNDFVNENESFNEYINNIIKNKEEKEEDFNDFLKKIL